MRLREADPSELVADDANERDDPAVADGFRRSVEQQGVIQPPIVRESDGGLSVVAGSRRAAAAREADLDTIPVVVAEWDDADALEASITENIDAFRQDVTDSERAAAVSRLMELRDCSRGDVAESLGVTRQAVQYWLEATRPEWEGTTVEPGYKQDDAGGSGKDSNASHLRSGDDTNDAPDHGPAELAAEIGGSTLRSIRTATGGGEAGEEMAHRVAKGDLTQNDVREITKQIGDGAGPETATENVAGGDADGMSVRVEMKLHGDDADSLNRAAQANDTTPEQIIRLAVTMYLEDEGWST